MKFNKYAHTHAYIDTCTDMCACNYIQIRMLMYLKLYIQIHIAV